MMDFKPPGRSASSLTADIWLIVDAIFMPTVITVNGLPLSTFNPFY